MNVLWGITMLLVKLLKDEQGSETSKDWHQLQQSMLWSRTKKARKVANVTQHLPVTVNPVLLY